MESTGWRWRPHPLVGVVDAEGEAGELPVPRVVFIGGWGRAGSTLLEGVVAHSADVVGLGETSQLWSHGSALAQFCSCGQPLEDCPQWARIQALQPCGWPEVVERMCTLERRWLRVRNVARLLGSRPWPGADGVRRYAEGLVQLYRAAAGASGAAVVVDSSKKPLVLAALSQVDGLDLRVIHLVRDPRAVVNSWRRHRIRRFGDGSERTLRQYGYGSSLLQWVLNNLLVSLVGWWAGLPVHRVSYEELVGADCAALERVAAFAGLPPPERRGDAVWAPPIHAIAGNPVRVAGDWVALSFDEGWRDELTLVGRIVGALGLPLYWMLRGRGVTSGVSGSWRPGSHDGLGATKGRDRE